MPDPLEDALRLWDGKSTELLENVFSKHSEDPEFLDCLLGHCADPDSERAATWLIKHALERAGERLSESQTSRHFDDLSGLTTWEAKLHFLQYLEKLQIPEDGRRSLTVFIQDAGNSDNKFVRAWAYFGLALLACRFPEERVRCLDLLETAARVETAGSIKVRVRKALEKLQRQSS